MISLKKKPNVTIQDRIEYRYIERVDTFTRTKIVPKYLTRTRIEKDTLRINDTTKIEVEIPIETKIYEETFINDSCNINFKAQISGYKTQLDSILIDVRSRQKEVIKTHILKEKPSKLQCGIVGVCI